jgi:CelD/BcsL family acetyltransferase involved in cellulose biosynthesis
MKKVTDFKIRLVEDIETFEKLKEPWTALLEESPIQDIFLTWEWLFAWWKHYASEDKRLWLITAWEGEKLCGVAPLMIKKKKKYKIPFHILRNLGFPEADVGGFIVPASQGQVLTAMANFMIEHQEDWDAIYLSEFHENDPHLLKLKNSLKQAGLAILTKSKIHFYLKTEGEWKSYYAGMSKNLRKDIKRRTKRAREEGKLEYKRYRGTEITWEHFETIFKINQAGQHSYIYKSATQRAFQRELFELMRDKGWLDIQFLSLDGKPVAFNYGFRYKGRYEDWRGAYDKQYHNLSLGKLLMRMALEDNFNDGIGEYDFLRGAAYYKTNWQPSKREFIVMRAASKRNIPALLSYIWLPRLNQSFIQLAQRFNLLPEKLEEE